MTDNENITDQFRDLFIFETGKYLDEVDGILLETENQKKLTGEKIKVLFRIMHTVKSTAAMMGYQLLSAFSHSLEDLFTALQKDESCGTVLDEKLFDLLFSAFEAMRQELKGAPGNMEGEETFRKLTQQIEGFTESIEKAGQPKREAPKTAALAMLHIMLEPGCAMPGIRAFIICTELKKICPALVCDPANLEKRPELAESVLKNGFTITFPAEYLDTVTGIAASALYVQKVAPLSAAPAKKEAVEKDSAVPASCEEEAPKAAVQEAETEKMVNVYLSKLDTLQDLMGELVIAESMAESAMLSSSDLSDKAALSVQRLKKLTDVMRSVIMSLRMTKVSDLFRKMHKVSRDAARSLNRNIEFETEGAEIAADRRILDELGEVLSHVIRNAVTHGIEEEAERLAMGKPAVGHIKMSARSTGNGIVITISDDGRGISLPLVLEAARKKGIPVKETAGYSNAELLQLLMTSGLSTHSQVTQYSGRGVGLDAVRASVRKLRGTITLESEEGRGTTFIINIPQTLAIMNCIRLRVAGSLYMLPVADVYRIVVPSENNLITLPDGSNRLLFQNFTIPLLRLDRLFGLSTEEKALTKGIVVVIEGEESACAISADSLEGQQRAVIKPLPRLLRCFGTERIGISGCTILGDGSISLIIDADSMLERAKEAML